MLPEVTLKYKLIVTQQICSLQGKLQAWILEVVEGELSRVKADQEYSPVSAGSRPWV